MVKPHARVNIRICPIRVFQSRNHFENGTISFTRLFDFGAAVPEHTWFSRDGFCCHVRDEVWPISRMRISIHHFVGKGNKSDIPHFNALRPCDLNFGLEFDF
jgi:hypothetical protein